MGEIETHDLFCFVKYFFSLHRLVGECESPWRTIIEDIKSLSFFFDYMKYNHVFREANFTAAVITSVGHHASNMYLGRDDPAST